MFLKVFSVWFSYYEQVIRYKEMQRSSGFQTPFSDAELPLSIPDKARQGAGDQCLRGSRNTRLGEATTGGTEEPELTLEGCCLRSEEAVWAHIWGLYLV